MSPSKRTTRPAPWAEPRTRQRCNFHSDRLAVLTYAGTPVCDGCIDRLGPAVLT
jgi:hypothetical protein